MGSAISLVKLIYLIFETAALAFLFVALPLASEATKGEPVAATVGILRVDVAGVEVQAAAICGISQ